jgi:site-specific DNA recombinase
VSRLSRRPRPGDEGYFRQTRSLRHLYPRLYRPGSRSGVQFAGCAVRGLICNIRSQAHAGWTLIKARHDDGGYSGGSTDRPDLQRLLDDIRARKIDVIVVYKVDRLTRSLADFAKLVELFDAHGVSFVSVTQQFNTTTSMGRLTLNVLLSFAQFEREVTSERIRVRSQRPSARGSGSAVPSPSAMR